MKIAGCDSSSRAFYIVEAMRVEWEYESDRKRAIAEITRALEDAYAQGLKDGGQEHER